MKVFQSWPDSPLGNFNYIIVFGSDCYVVDPFDSEKIQRELESRNLKLIGIINTHSHWDHVKGNIQLKDIYQCEVICHHKAIDTIPGATKGIRNGDVIEIGEDKIIFSETPGHIEDHICLFLETSGEIKAVISGDTLFNAGVGNCRNGGNVDELYQTFQHHFFQLDDSVVVYPGHDYILNNLKFTLSIEPDNSYASELLYRLENDVSHEYCTYLTTIGEEKKMNTFFRLNSSTIRQKLEKVASSDKEVFVELRSLRDNW